MRLKRLTNLNKEYDMYIKWRLTALCNFSCSYCVRKDMTNHALSESLIKEQEEILCKTAKKLNNLLDNSNFKCINIDLIGGEVSILDLKKILAELTTEKLKKINITTNFSQPADYYNSLASFLKERDIKLSITASFHFESISFDKYFEKVLEVKDNCYLFACEIVSLSNNQDLAYKFKEKCEEIDVDYLIEADVRRKYDDSESTQSLLTCGKKKNKGNRYEVEFMDGTIKQYATRNLFISDTSIEENGYPVKGIKTSNFICTCGWNFFYIDIDTVVSKTKNKPNCTQRISIEDFEIVEPTKCFLMKDGVCTLCGHMDLLRIEEP